MKRKPETIAEVITELRSLETHTFAIMHKLKELAKVLSEVDKKNNQA